MREVQYDRRLAELAANTVFRLVGSPTHRSRLQGREFVVGSRPGQLILCAEAGLTKIAQGVLADENGINVVEGGYVKRR